jgi:uncharacterized membrane protein
VRPPLAPAITVSAVAWVALLITAPVLSVPLAAALYGLGSLICHQIAERSFYLHGFQLPVCARCLGLYTGGALGSVAAVFMARVSTARPARRSGAPLMATVLALVPTIATVAIERGAGWPVSNVVRAAAALPLGWVVAFVVMRAIATLHYDECAPRRPIGHGQPPAST